MSIPYNGPYPSASSIQQQQFFPQPQGNAYVINSSLEVANVPNSGSITLALCPSENLLYLKSMQNGSPVFLAYKTIPYEPEKTNINEYEKRIAALEDEIKELKKGGNLHELL